MLKSILMLVPCKHTAINVGVTCTKMPSVDTVINMRTPNDCNQGRLVTCISSRHRVDFALSPRVYFFFHVPHVKTGGCGEEVRACFE